MADLHVAAVWQLLKIYISNSGPDPPPDPPKSANQTAATSNPLKSFHKNLMEVHTASSLRESSRREEAAWTSEIRL